MPIDATWNHQLGLGRALASDNVCTNSPCRLTGWAWEIMTTKFATLQKYSESQPEPMHLMRQAMD
jgi:hypothetical protein